MTKDCFIEAQKVTAIRQSSRNADGVSSHPNAKRTYSLRSFLFCAWCGRRMSGKAPGGTVYYVCAPPKECAPEGHPNTIRLREDLIIAELSDFFADHVFGPHHRRHPDPAPAGSAARLRATELTGDRASLTPQHAAGDQDQPAPQPERLSATPPSSRIDLGRVPDAQRRRLFEAVRLRIDFDQRSRTCHFQITVTGR